MRPSHPPMNIYHTSRISDRSNWKYLIRLHIVIIIVVLPCAAIGNGGSYATYAKSYRRLTGNLAMVTDRKKRVMSAKDPFDGWLQLSRAFSASLASTTLFPSSSLLQRQTGHRPKRKDRGLNAKKTSFLFLRRLSC